MINLEISHAADTFHNHHIIIQCVNNRTGTPRKAFPSRSLGRTKPAKLWLKSLKPDLSHFGLTRVLLLTSPKFLWSTTLRYARHETVGKCDVIATRTTGNRTNNTKGKLKTEKRWKAGRPAGRRARRRDVSDRRLRPRRAERTVRDVDCCYYFCSKEARLPDVEEFTQNRNIFQSTPHSSQGT